MVMSFSVCLGTVVGLASFCLDLCSSVDYTGRVHYMKPYPYFMIKNIEHFSLTLKVSAHLSSLQTHVNPRL